MISKLRKQLFDRRTITIMTLATVAIVSIGDMGVGIARLLLANNIRVITNVKDRRYRRSESILTISVLISQSSNTGAGQKM